MEVNESYMRRALSLAANGRGFTAPNPMVGAVIVAYDGRVIGEGWHRRCGQGHAEVNAIASVKDCDRHLLKDSTIYVTLEPCSHYGKTPPCAKLIVDTGIPRVVVGAGDPNPKVNGRGIEMIRNAGAEVVTGVLADESVDLNRVFFTAQTLRRPYITLKWAQSADGFMDAERGRKEPAYAFSNPMTRLSTMKLRGENEAILTTAATVNADNPRLSLRGWDGRPPRPFIIDRRGSLSADCRLMSSAVRIEDVRNGTDDKTDDRNLPVVIADDDPFGGIFSEFGITSVLVEAGPRYLTALLESGMWDSLRVEISPVVLGKKGTHPAPVMPFSTGILEREEMMGSNRMLYFTRCK